MRALLPLLGCALSACQLWTAELPDPNCEWLEVDAATELLVTDGERRSSPHARNAKLGGLSFAARVASLGTIDARALWTLVGVDAPRLQVEELPFRLLAVVNRTDLAAQLAPESPAGEGRLVYVLTAGPGDDVAVPALPLTVIFEYSLGRADSSATWAKRFHALSFEQPASARWTAVEALVRAFAKDTPRISGGPHLSQVRVNDARSGTSTLHEFAFDGAAIVVHGLRNTPRLGLAGTRALSDFVAREEATITAGMHRVPTEWLATVATAASIDWGTDAPVAVERQFSRGTCSGCHGELGPSRAGFHVSERDTGEAVLSTFLTEEELPRRTALQRALLCESGQP